MDVQHYTDMMSKKMASIFGAFILEHAQKNEINPQMITIQKLDDNDIIELIYHSKIVSCVCLPDGGINVSFYSANDSVRNLLDFVEFNKDLEPDHIFNFDEMVIPVSQVITKLNKYLL